MTTKVRHGVFETNSSSTHAISICEKPTFDQTIPVGASGKIEVYGDEFGWEWREYSSAEKKLSYAATWAVSNGRYLDLLKKVVEDHTGGTLSVLEDDDDEDYFDGYIDHQSYEVMEEVFEQGEDALKRFLFCSESILITGNDNSDAPDWACEAIPEVYRRYEW